MRTNPSVRASACVSGAFEGREIRGRVTFVPFRAGVLVTADVRGLPPAGGPCPESFYALHIHEGDSCAGEGFSLTGGHFDPGGCPHPDHAGDLPPLLAGSCGTAYFSVYTTRFTIPQILGKTVVIHAMRDDFTTQPSGGAGEKIACGVIRRG